MRLRGQTSCHLTFDTIMAPRNVMKYEKNEVDSILDCIMHIMKRQIWFINLLPMA